MMASELADQVPSKITDEMAVTLPHTRASFKIQANDEKILKNHFFSGYHPERPFSRFPNFTKGNAAN